MSCISYLGICLCIVTEVPQTEVRQTDCKE